VIAFASKVSVSNKDIILYHFTVNTSTLLLPPLVQPKSEEFPLGVSTLTFTDPGPEITPVVSITFNC